MKPSHHDTSPLGYCLGIQWYDHFIFPLLLSSRLCASHSCLCNEHNYHQSRDGGNLRGSTELDNKSGHNCQMTDVTFQIFAHLVLGLDSTHNGMGTGIERYMQRNHSFVNMLLADLAMITNLHPVIHKEITNNQ